ncbi:MAG: globin domain-containing protein [Planctomycetaceae bacterium]
MTISESVEQLLGSKVRVTEQFYSLLFSRHPELKVLFARSDMRMQATMLTMALASVESYYSHHFPATEHYFQVLGHRHFHAGVRRDDFIKFEITLLDVLREFHQQDWSADLEAEWRDATRKAVSKMEEGYTQTFTY